MRPASPPLAAEIVHVIGTDAARRTSVSWLLRSAGHDVRAHATPAAFLLAHRERTAACVLVDLEERGEEDATLLHAIAERGEGLPVILIADEQGRATVTPTASVVTVLKRPVQRPALLAAVRMALARGARRSATGDYERDLRTRYESLTPRERQVFDRLAAGMRDAQIAVELGIGDRTIKAHRARVMEKMQAGSLADLLRLSGELPPLAPPPGRPKPG